MANWNIDILLVPEAAIFRARLSWYIARELKGIKMLYLPDFASILGPFKDFISNPAKNLAFEISKVEHNILSHSLILFR